MAEGSENLYNSISIGEVVSFSRNKDSALNSQLLCKPINENEEFVDEEGDSSLYELEEGEESLSFV